METKEDENGKKYEVKTPLWPFQWTQDRDKGVTTFEECLESLQKKPFKYLEHVKFKQEAESFYDGGYYDFLVEQEKRFSNHTVN